tara:strand:- start:276 stop:962 length:687 start_codon:yes stop_codon:yes gene_type:complete
MINQIDALIRRETQKAIRAILESNLSQNSSDEERERQQAQKKSVDSRDLKAHDGQAEKKDEASDDDSQEEKEAKPKKREDRSKGKGTADSPKLKAPKKAQIENPQVSSVVDKLNALRGGKSLSDPNVRKSFEQYFNGLNVQEKQSLLLFLTGIAQILTGTEVGADAAEPGDVGLRVKDTPSGSDKKIKNTPGKDDKSKEGTTSNPIVVGEVASKHSIMRVLKAYKDNS